MTRIIKRLAFPVGLLTLVGVVFFALGPASAGPAGPRLSDMAPPGAGDGAYAAPAGASATELEIAERYGTVRRFPDTVDAYILLGNAYVQHVRETADPADYGRAEAAFRAALQRDPQKADALIGLGVVALARHEFTEALSLGEQAVAIAPKTSRAHGVVVDALTELGRYDDAVASAQRMVDLRPDLASLSRVSYQRELRGDIEGAIEAMARAYDASTGAPAEQREYLRVLIGDLHLAKGDTATAETIYNASLQVVPGFIWAEAGMARAATARGDLDAAVRHYSAAADTVPLPELLIALGEAQSAAGLGDEASDTFAVVRAMQQLFAENGVNVDLELALFEANHGDPQRAVELARAAYATQPNVKAADALGWALYRAGQSEDARAYSTEALRLGSTSGQFHFHAGMIAFAQGDRAAAREHLERALTTPGTISALYAEDARTALAAIDPTT